MINIDNWKNITNTLCLIGDQFNKEKIFWGVGASIVMKCYGIYGTPHDIDLCVDEKDIQTANEILKNMGIRKLPIESGIFATKFFYQYEINGTDVDVMGGFAVNYDGGKYQYIFDDKSITQIKNINGVKIPITALEDWYAIYQLLPGRKAQVKTIENYLKNSSMKNTYLLKRAINAGLPKHIEERIQKLIDNRGV